jgi:hypothetical protein
VESKVEYFGKERFIILFVKKKKKLLDSDIKKAEHVCMNDVWPIALYVLQNNLNPGRHMSLTKYLCNPFGNRY